jgi:catechol 2,3-dioxygenase-like lactoylglutathione lyase family enzyme
MSVTAFDHVAIPTAKPEEMLRFYRALGFAVPSPEEWVARGVPFFSIQFGDNKINVHAPELWGNAAFTLRGVSAEPGCGDFCFVWSGSLDELRRVLRDAGAPIEEGPVERVGGRDAGRAKGTSLYTRDPDRNLLEFIVYEPAV